MKNNFGVITWAIASVLIICAMTFGYQKQAAKEAKIPYRCYLHINLDNDFYKGEREFVLLKSEIDALKVGSTVRGFVVGDKSKPNSGMYEFNFNYNDNPTIEDGRMRCFE